MILRRIFLLAIVTTLLVSCDPYPSSQWVWKGEEYTYDELLPFDDSPFIFYNVENLFDTINDPDKNDDEFTPKSPKNWDSKKYYDKLQKLAEVLTFPSRTNPLFVGLAEVETRGVVEDLMQTGRLSQTQYRVVHFESPDIRGIDVSFAYDSQRFIVEHQEGIPFYAEKNPRIKTRNILYVKGGLKDSLIVHIFVNHWPSRREGTHKSEYKRIAAAEILRRKTDSIRAIDKDANILIMGDFNDYPPSHSLVKVLEAGEPDEGKNFVNIMLPMQKRGLGSFRYQRKWGFLDQFIVSPNLIHTNKGLAVKDGEAYLIDDDKFMFFYEDGEKTPNKTYAGDKYLGGYSDHLAIYGFLENRK